MEIEVARVLEMRARVVSYRDRQQARSLVDDRFSPDALDFLRQYIQPHFRVLDVGCGDGFSLLESADCFHEGIGIDVLPRHVELAETRRAREGITNVSFVECDCKCLPFRFEPESFDLVFCESGPLVESSVSVQAALDVLQPGGLVFMAEIARSASTEWREWNAGAAVERPPGGFVPSEQQAATLLMRNGVDIRILARLDRTRRYLDVYEWLLARFAGWGPETPVDDRFLRQVSDFMDAWGRADGSIEVREQYWWVGGVKVSKPPTNRTEHQLFQGGVGASGPEEAAQPSAPHCGGLAG